MSSRRIAHSVAFLAFVTWATVLGSLSLWGFLHDAERRDFGYFVQSANAWRDTGVLYENVPRVNLNPPHASLVLFTPLTWIPFEAAVKLWAILQIVTLVTAIVLIARELRLTPGRIEWVAPAIVASAMTSHNWIEGQVGGVLLVGGVVAWLAVRRSQHHRASIALAALVSLKPHLVFMVPAAGWRTTLRTGLIGTAGLIFGFFLIGEKVWMSWVAMTRVKGLQLPAWNVSIAPVLHRAGMTDGSLYLFPALAAVILAVSWKTTTGDQDRDRIWVIWGIAMLLIGPVTWVYYAATFLGPLIAWGERYGWPPAAKAGILLWLLPLQVANWTASLPHGWKLGIIGSPYTWGAILLWVSAIASRHQPESASSFEASPTCR